MHRHVKTVHADFKGDETIDDRENPEIIDEDDASDKADDDDSNIKDKAETDDSDIDVEEAEEGAAEEEEAGKEEVSDDPWRLLIEEAFEQCHTEFDERVTKHMAIQVVDEDDTRKRVYDNMLQPTETRWRTFSLIKCSWFHAMRNDPIFLSVKTTVSDLKLLDDYDNEKAWKSAVSKRKFQLDRILRVRSAGIVRARRWWWWWWHANRESFKRKQWLSRRR